MVGRSVGIAGQHKQSRHCECDRRKEHSSGICGRSAIRSHHYRAFLITLSNETALPFFFLLTSAADINANISMVSSGVTGISPVSKYLAMSINKGKYP